MDAQHKLLLDTNRYHLDNMKNGFCKNVPIDGLRLAGREALNVIIPVDETSFNSVLSFLEKTYAAYDKWIEESTITK